MKGEREYFVHGLIFQNSDCWFRSWPLMYSISLKCIINKKVLIFLAKILFGHASDSAPSNKLHLNNFKRLAYGISKEECADMCIDS